MSKKKALLSALFVMLLWGSLFPVVKVGYAVYHIRTTGDILLFAGIRFTVCGAVICLYSLWKDRASYAAVKTSLWPVLLSGFIAVTLHYGFTYLGLNDTDSSKTAILKQVGVLFYVCFSFLFFKDDKPTLKKSAAAVLGFAGIITINAGSGGIVFHLGDLFIIAASFCTVFSNVISKKALATVKPVTMTGVSQLFGGFLLLAVGIMMGGSMELTWQKAYILLYIFAASIISYCLWFIIVKQGELSRLFIIKFAEPMFACIFGALLLGEDIFKIQYLLAFLLIAGGICLSNSRGN